VLSRFQLQEGLNRLDLTFEKLDLQLVIDRYAVPGREELTFADFESMIMPKSPVFRMDMATRKVRKELSQESKQLLKKLLRKLIDSESEIEVLRERVRNHTNEEQRGLYDLLGQEKSRVPDDPGVGNGLRDSPRLAASVRN